jgi:hypothetical protein
MPHDEPFPPFTWIDPDELPIWLPEDHQSREEVVSGGRGSLTGVAAGE